MKIDIILTSHLLLSFRFHDYLDCHCFHALSIPDWHVFLRKGSEIEDEIEREMRSKIQLNHEWAGWPHIDGVSSVMIQPQWDQNKLAKRVSQNLSRCTFRNQRVISHLCRKSAYSGKTGIHSDLFIKEVWQELWKVTWQKRSSAPGVWGLSGEGRAVVWEFF